MDYGYKIDAEAFKQVLIGMKEQITLQLDRTVNNKLKDLFISKIQVIETILLWLHQSQQNGGNVDMEILKIGLGKTVKLKDIVPVRSKLDAAIIEEAKFLKEPGDARMIDPKAVTVSYFKNRVYRLAKDGKIPADARPIQSGEELYLALKPSSRKPDGDGEKV